MGTLVAGLVIIGGILAVVAVLALAGVPWLNRFLGPAFFVLVSVAGVLTIFYGMENQRLVAIVAGIALTLVGFIAGYQSLSDE
jgi:hypothetical protein